jgi:nucleotide-binding universal stress UspA family protein
MAEPRVSRRWLLAVDGSCDANRAAAYVARWAGVFRVERVDVLNAQPLASYRAFALNRNEILLEAGQRAMEATAVARSVLDDARIAYELHTEIGEPADAVIAAARSGNASEIVIGSRGLGAFAHLVVGSVAYKVVHLAEIPVTIVTNPCNETHLPSPEQADVHRVLLPLDGSQHGNRAIDYVRALADAEGPVGAVLLNVQLPTLSGESNDFVAHDTIDSAHREAGEAVLAPARTTLEREGIRCESHVTTGFVPRTIVQLAERHRCTRIVMGARGLGAIGNLMLGSVAYRVVHLATVPVTVAK